MHEFSNRELLKGRELAFVGRDYSAGVPLKQSATRYSSARSYGLIDVPARRKMRQEKRQRQLGVTSCISTSTTRCQRQSVQVAYFTSGQNNYSSGIVTAYWVVLYQWSTFLPSIICFSKIASGSGTTRGTIIFLLNPGSRNLSAWKYHDVLLSTDNHKRCVRSSNTTWLSLLKVKLMWGGYRDFIVKVWGQFFRNQWKYVSTSFHGVENNQGALEWHGRICMLRLCFVGACSLILPRKPSQKPALWYSHSKTDPQMMDVFGMRDESGHHAASWR